MLVDATDSRMFEVLKEDHGIEYAMLMPLMESGRMLGSLHLGLTDDALFRGEAEEDLLAHLANIASGCFVKAVKQAQISQLTMLDPLTQISNVRGFRKDIAREIARARRADTPLSVLMMEIDEYDDLTEHYSDATARFSVQEDHPAHRFRSARHRFARATLRLANRGAVARLQRIHGGGNRRKDAQRYRAVHHR